jgi:hypothetical protein
MEEAFHDLIFPGKTANIGMHTGFRRFKKQWLLIPRNLSGVFFSMLCLKNLCGFVKQDSWQLVVKKSI